MRETYKYLFLFIVGILLTGIMTTICIVDFSVTFLVFAILSAVIMIGSLIMFIQEYKEDNKYAGKRKRRSGKRFK